MGMGPPRNDAWLPYRRVRFVLVRRAEYASKPWQGFVVGWQEDARGFKARVLYVDDEGPCRDAPKERREWFRVELLTPVRADPNWVVGGPPMPEPDPEAF